MRTKWLQPAAPDDEPGKELPLHRQLAWFAGLSAASLIVVAVVAYALRGLLFL